MPDLPGVPIASVPATSAPNADLPATAMPSLPRIGVTERVGPPVANRQHAALEKRDETIRGIVNLLVTAVNAVNTNFVRRDGVGGMGADLLLNGFRLAGMGSSVANGQGVEHSQMVTEIAARAAADAGLQSQINAKAAIASPTFTGTPTAPTPPPGDDSTRLATTAFVQDLLAVVQDYVDYNIEGDGSAFSAGGVFYFNNLTIGGAQALSKPVHIFCQGNFTVSPTNAITNSLTLIVEVGGAMVVNGSISATMGLRIVCQGNCTITGNISSSGPIEFDVGGNLTINGTVTGSYVSMKVGGDCSTTSLVSSHTDGLYWRKYPVVPEYFGLPHFNVAGAIDDIVSYPASGASRPVLIDVVGNAAFTGLEGDDVIVKAGGSITLNADVRAYWWMVAYGAGVSYYWNDGYRDCLAARGGAGGTAGGWGQASPATYGSIWRDTTKPFLLHNYALARGGSGADTRAGQLGSGGGRALLYAGVNFNSNGFAVDADGRSNGSSSGWDAGGGGTVRVVARGTITGGTYRTNGGTGNGSQEPGAGGGTFLMASAYSGSPVLQAIAPASAVSGTTTQLTTTTAVIDGLRDDGVFDTRPPEA